MNWKRHNWQAGQGKPGCVVALPPLTILLLLATVLALSSGSNFRTLGLVLCALENGWITIVLLVSVLVYLQDRPAKSSILPLLLFAIWLPTAAYLVIAGVWWFMVIALVINMIIVFVIFRLARRESG